MANEHVTLDLNACGIVDPQQSLGMALAQKDIRGFCRALDMGADPEQQDDTHTSLYEEALKTYGSSMFVRECLNRGCNPNYINQHLNKPAIIYAADSRDPQIITALLQHKGVQVDSKYAQLTPLNTVTKNITAENVKDVTECIRLLLNYGASANIPDQRDMTPLHYILKNKKINKESKRELIKMFLDLSQDLDIDFYRDGEVRNILSEEFADLKLPEKRSSPTAININILLRFIRNGDEKKFIQFYHDYMLNDSLVQSNEEKPIILLIESIKRFTHEASDAILASNIDINQLHNGNSAIEIAAIWGNWVALKSLLAHNNLQIRNKDHLLHTVIKKLDEMPANDGCDFNKCFYTLLDSEHISVNEADESGSTPLHYAVKYRNRIAIQELLKRGAYIGKKNIFSDLPIDDMPPELLEEHFDRCISSNKLKAGDQNFQIIMDYNNLIPRQSHSAASSNKASKDNEMTPISFIAESKELRHLLQHPLLTSFLYLKWHRLSAIFYINFLLYIFFAVSIVTHTILKFSESEHQNVTQLFGFFSWLGIIYLLIRELIQFILSPRAYVFSVINVLEFLLIVCSIMTVIEPTFNQNTKRALAVFTILLVAIELCLLVGSLPVLSISTHMLMLRAVSTTFIKSFALYSIFVITFSLCFYILFGKTVLEAKDSPKHDEKDDKDETNNFNKFSDPFAVVIKIIVMMTGEFDASSIEFETFYSYLIFLLFVIFMSIVLFNLLNGLAVSDTQVIKSQAELNGSICRVYVLSRYEEVLTGPFGTICGSLIKVYPNQISQRQIGVLPNNGKKIKVFVENPYEMTAVLESGNETRNSKAKFLPKEKRTYNELEYNEEGTTARTLNCCFSCITDRCAEMDTKTVKLALAVLEKNSTQQQNQRIISTEQRLQFIEQKLDKVFELLNNKNYK